MSLEGESLVTPSELEDEHKFLEFTDKFETKFLTQGAYENRDIFASLDIAWTLPGGSALSLPSTEAPAWSARAGSAHTIKPKLRAF